MKVASRKAKGRNLQNWIADKIKTIFTIENPELVRPAIMGETGEDIKLLDYARKRCPIKIECKNNETHTGIYREYEQAVNHKGEYEPVLFIKMNRQKPLAVVDAEYLLRLIRQTNDRQ